MEAKRHEKMLISIREIEGRVSKLPPREKHYILNRCSNLKIMIRKSNEKETEMEATIKFNARQAILEALLQGRHLSQMDCREFQIEDMRTPISHMKDRWSATHELKTRWITSPVRNSRIKEYWLEERS